VAVAAIFVALMVHLRVWLNDRPTPLPPVAVFVADEPDEAPSPAVANAPAAPLWSTDPSGIFALRGFRPGRPAAMDLIDKLNQRTLEDFHRAHPPMPTPHFGPPDPQEILNRLHGFDPAASASGSPSTQPTSAGQVTYTPTYFEYHIQYDSEPEQQRRK
jgi:hypothetical protein